MLLFILSFALVIILCFILIPISKRIGLIDSPDDPRKIHTIPTPLVGGIAIFISVSIISLIHLPYQKDLLGLYTACFLLVLIGTLDDRFNLSHWFRLGIQALSALILIHFADTELTSFGEIAWKTPIHLGLLSTPITVIAVIGVLNAYNMMDGMDGLVSGLGLITLFSLIFLLFDTVNSVPVQILFIICGALLAHLFVNLGGAKNVIEKIFMGDAGSMALGFVITAFLIRYSQQPRVVFEPATALWLVAVPLMDITVTTSRRVMRGKSPFHPDKTHIHHIFIHAGFSKHQTLIIILCMQIICSAIGLILHKLEVMPTLSLVAFLTTFFCYRQLTQHAFKFSKWMKKIINHNH